RRTKVLSCPIIGDLVKAAKLVSSATSRTNRVCPGYVEGLDLVLRLQNKFGKAIAENYRRKSTVDEAKSPTQQGSTPSLASTVLYPPLAESKEFYAQTFFVSAYVTFPHDCRSDRGCLEVLALMLNQLKPGSLLSMALSVVSYSLYAAWDPEIRNGENTETQAAYANAIRALRAALSDPKECISDETLMAVCILGYYEVWLQPE
ncbi:MAG: hypothetical protein Q9214_001444, partial [Letrouitia sp. 1 TL-2023]